MILDYLSNGKDGLIMFILSIPVILFSLSFHEAAHGYIAYKMGDPTARNFGRLTLNPLKHLTPLGTITMLVFGYGWAEPVPINTRNFKNPRVGMALTAIAGPISNFILGLISCLFETITRVIFLFSINGSETFFSVMLVLMTFFQISAILNFGFMAFNLIPLPPFDGSRFFYLFLPSKWYFKVMKYEQTIMIAVLLGCFVLSRFNCSPVSIIANSLYSYVTMLMNLVYILVSNLIL